MSRQRISNNADSLTKLEDGKLYCHTVFHDDDALDRNKAIKNSGAMEKSKFGLHDDEDIRMIISCPDTMQWAIFRKKHPDTYRLIKSRDEAERMKGARQLQILHPAWVIMDRLQVKLCADQYYL